METATTRDPSPADSAIPSVGQDPASARPARPDAGQVPVPASLTRPSADQDSAPAASPGASQARARRARQARRPRPLPAAALRLLLDLARFGYLTPGQATALAARRRRTVNAGTRELQRRGWLSVRRVICGPIAGRMVVYALTRRGRIALKRRTDRPPANLAATIGRLDETVATVDVALHLQAQGAGTWQTWAEYRRDHPWAAGLRLPPKGVLHGVDGTDTPVWVVLDTKRAASLRSSADLLHRHRELKLGQVFALETIFRRVQDLRLPASTTAWTPPHLHGRTPLLPGWNAGTASAEAGGTDTDGEDRPTGALGPAMLTVLAFLDRFGYATVWQVVRATGRSPKAVCRTLDLLKVGGLAQQHVDVPCPGRPAAWSATAAGLAAVGSRRRALPSAPLHRRHSLALVDLAFALEAEYGGRWEAERELDSDIGPQWGNDCIACPDGRLTLPDGQRILIQLQLSQGKVNDQYRHAWRQRARGLGREVWFYCTRDTAPRYRRALKAGDATFIRVLEWKPPDHSGGVREVDATWQRRRARTKTAAGRAVGASANR